jgi:hypothetical protein
VCTRSEERNVKTNMHEIRLLIPSKIISPIVELVESEGGRLLGMTASKEVVKTNGEGRYEDGAHDKGITAKDFVLTVLADGPKTTREIETAFANKAHPKFADSTPSATLSEMVKKKILDRGYSDKGVLVYSIRYQGAT